MNSIQKSSSQIKKSFSKFQTASHRKINLVNKQSRIFKRGVTQKAIRTLFEQDHKNGNHLVTLLRKRLFISTKKSKIEKSLVSNQGFNFRKLNNSIDDSIIYNNNEKSLEIKSSSEKKECRDLSEMKNVYDSFEEDELIYEKEDLNYSMVKKKYFLIPQKSFPKFLIEILLFSLNVYSIIFTTYNLSFEITNTLIEIIVEVLYLLYMLSIFFTQISDLNDDAINDLSKISYNYVSGGFLYDLVINFPYFLFYYIFQNNDFSFYFLYLKWLIILRVIKIANEEKLFESNIFQTRSKSFTVFKMLIIFILLVHTSTCLWIFISYHNSNSWIVASGLQQNNQSNIYIASVYFQLVTIYTVGYGDIVSQNMSERIFNSILLCVGVIVYSFGLTALSQILVDQSQRKLKFLNKFYLLEMIHNELKFDHKLYKAIKRSIVAEFKCDDQSRFELLDNLPNFLKQELMKYLRNSILMNIEFFRNQPSQFVINVMSYLRRNILKKHQIIFELGSVVDEMYIVHSGTLSINLGEEFKYFEIGIISADFHFGDLFIETNSKSPYEIRCKSKHTDVFVLKKHDYFKIKENFRSNILNILQDSYFFMEQIHKKRRQFLELMSYENSIEKVKKLYIALNNYLMERGFINLYNHQAELEDVNEFLFNTPKTEIQSLINTLLKNNRKNSLIKRRKRIEFENKHQDLNNEKLRINALKLNLKKKNGKSLKLGDDDNLANIKSDDKIDENEEIERKNLYENMRNAFENFIKGVNTKKNLESETQKTEEEKEVNYEIKEKDNYLNLKSPLINHVKSLQKKATFKILDLPHFNEKILNNLFKKKSIELYRKCLQNNGDVLYLLEFEKFIDKKIISSLVDKNHYKSVFSAYEEIIDSNQIENIKNCFGIKSMNKFKIRRIESFEILPRKNITRENFKKSLEKTVKFITKQDKRKRIGNLSENPDNIKFSRIKKISKSKFSDSNYVLKGKFNDQKEISNYLIENQKLDWIFDFLKMNSEN